MWSATSSSPPRGSSIPSPAAITARSSTASTRPSCCTTSDDSVVVSADPATANVARMVTYRPLPGQAARTVTVTMKILSRPSGEGKDYASMTVLASKEHHPDRPAPDSGRSWTRRRPSCRRCVPRRSTGRVSARPTRIANGVTGDMRSFIEIVPNGDGYKFVRDMDGLQRRGRQGRRHRRLVRCSAVPVLPVQQQRHCGTRDPAADPAPVQHKNYHRQRADLYGVRQVLGEVPERSRLRTVRQVL